MRGPPGRRWSHRGKEIRPVNQLLQARKQPGWSQLQVIAQMTAVARSMGVTLPVAQTMRVQLSGWENNRHQPSDLYRKLLAGVFELSQVELGFGAGAALAGGAELLAGAFESGDDSVDGDVRVLCGLFGSECG